MIPVGIYEIDAAVGHGHRVALVGFHHLLETEYLLGRHMVLPDSSRMVSGQLLQVYRKGVNMVVG